MDPLIFHILVMFASLALLAWASDLAVLGISRYAKQLGISDYLIGMVVVSIASSIPELVSSLNGALLGEGGIVIGTIMGANLVELTLVVGSIALVGKKVSLDSQVLHRSKKIVCLLNFLPFLLIIDGTLSRFDGALLVATYCGYVYLLWKQEGKLGKLKKDVLLKHLWKNMLIFSGALVVMLLSSRFLVSSSIHLAYELGISAFYIALIVIGIGSSISDASVGIRSVLQGHHHVGLGNVLGSNLIKSLLFLGAIAIINPLVFPFSRLGLVLGFSIAAYLLILYFMSFRIITWKGGLVLFGGYCFFILAELVPKPF